VVSLRPMAAADDDDDDELAQRFADNESDWHSLVLLFIRFFGGCILLRFVFLDFFCFSILRVTPNHPLQDH
jgi:hypothetical protein